MKEKQTNNILKELGDVLVVIGSWVARVVTTVWNWVTGWQWQGIKRVLGVALIALGAVIVLLDMVVGLLMLTGPYQVAEIIRAWCDVYLFDYINLWAYVGFMAGGLVMEVVFATVLIWWGIYWYCGKNYFVSPRYAAWYAGALFALGFAVLSAAVFYSLPGIMKLHEDKHQYHHKHKKHLVQPVGTQVYYPSKQDFYRQQQEMEHIRRELQREFDRVWYR